VFIGLLKRYFYDWKERTKHQRYTNKQMQMALHHCQNKMMNKALYCLKLNVHSALRKKVFYMQLHVWHFCVKIWVRF